MKFQQYGKVNPDKKYKINPLQLAESVILKRLDFLLGFIKDRNDDLYARYIDQLESKIKLLTENLDAPIEKLEITKKLEEFTLINKHKELVILHYKFLIKLLDKPVTDILNSNEIMIPSKIYWQIVFGIRYYQAQALAEIMEKEEAIELFKEYINQYHLFVESTFKKYKTLEEMRQDHIDDAVKSTDPEIDVFISTVKDGVYIVRNNNCPAIEAMIDFDDKELVYLACCYGDYNYAIMSNKHFVMTRDFTIAEGDPYCDKVFHDTRIDKEVKHPTKEFLDKIGPILKECLIGEKMKFHKFGKINTNKMYKIKLIDSFENVIFKRLDFLLRLIKEKKEEQYENFVKKLTKKLQDKVAVKDLTVDKQEINALISNYKNLNDQNELTRLHLDLQIQILELTKKQLNSVDQIEIPSRINWRAVFINKYYQLLALIDVLGRNEGIELYKEYLDQYYVHTKSTFKHYNTLDEFSKEHLEEQETSTDGEFAVVYSTVENGVYIVRNDNCPAVEALDDIKDKELIYVICCYADYQYTIMSNEHFVMTRNYTVAEGDPYCDKVFHDTRIDKEVKHPTKEFLDSMGPILKKK